MGSRLAAGWMRLHAPITTVGDPKASDPLVFKPPVRAVQAVRGVPSGSGLLPARPPLRTVLESFPSYGSSPSNQYRSVEVRPGGSQDSNGNTIWTRRYDAASGNVAAMVVDANGHAYLAGPTATVKYDGDADGQTNPLGTGALSTNLLAVGSHTVQLVVSDGHDRAMAQIDFHVITAAMAVGQLLLLIDAADLGTGNKQPLIAVVLTAMSSFDRNDTVAGINQLRGFQNKVVGLGKRTLHVQDSPAMEISICCAQ